MKSFKLNKLSIWKFHCTVLILIILPLPGDLDNASPPITCLHVTFLSSYKNLCTYQQHIIDCIRRSLVSIVALSNNVGKIVKHYYAI